MADVKISDLTAAQAIGDSDLIELSQYSSNSYTSAKTTISALKSKVSGTIVSGTLTAGSTSITLQDASITTSSMIEVFNEFDVPYNSKTLSNGSITLTFDAQQSNMIVKVRVS